MYASICLLLCFMRIHINHKKHNSFTRRDFCNLFVATHQYYIKFKCPELSYMILNYRFLNWEYVICLTVYLPFAFFLSPAGFRIIPPGSQCPGYFFQISVVTDVMLQVASFSKTGSNKEEQQGLTVMRTGKLQLSLYHILHVNPQEVTNFHRQKK